MGLIDQLKKGWNAFIGRDPTYVNYGNGYAFDRPDRMRFSLGSERTIVTAIYNRIALDCAQIDIKHVRLDENGRYKEDIDSNFNRCLTLEANIDQTSRSFVQDCVMSMFDEGSIAIVPTDTTKDPRYHDDYDIYSLRVGKVVTWYPDHVRVKVYNEKKGEKEERTFPKSMIAIVENPLYAVINEKSSVTQQLIHTLALLSSVNDQTSSEKLNLIVQLPYSIKTPTKEKQAENRREAIEKQLTGSKYGIAYIDGTERVTQLNRSLDNQLMSQVEYLTSMLYSQLGVTQEILNGTADEKVMLNYYNRTIEPIISAITDEMKRKFLNEEARKDGESIEFYRDPFKLVPVEQLAELADKFTRNEIMTANEIRVITGMKPAEDPSADELRNKNISQPSAVVKEKQFKKINQEENQNGK